jgi:hypothetical protein
MNSRILSNAFADFIECIRGHYRMHSRTLSNAFADIIESIRGHYRMHSRQDCLIYNDVYYSGDKVQYVYNDVYCTHNGIISRIRRRNLVYSQ